jgi:hypothetical protein
MHFDVFNNDAFNLSQLSLAMVNRPHVPTRLGDLGLFAEQGVATTTISLESVGQTIKLVASAPRGAPGQTQSQNKRSLRKFSCVHLPQTDAIIADEIQNLRAFGSETDAETVMHVVNSKLDVMRQNLDVTMEWQRMGAIKGQVLDADGTTVLVDMHAEFGVTQQVVDMGLDSDTTKVKQKCTEVMRLVEDALGGIRYSGLLVLSSAGFFDAFVNHPAVEGAYDFFNASFQSTQQRSANGGGGFTHAGLAWEEYRGKVGSQSFIADGEAYVIPLGVPNLFRSFFGPADYMETVNTIGLPYYARQWAMDNGKGVNLEAQSNPLHLCTRPRAIVKLTASR